MAYNADYAGQQAAGGGQQAYDPNSVDPETAKAYEQAWAQYYAALGTDPNAAAAAAATAGQDVSAGGVENAIGGGRWRLLKNAMSSCYLRFDPSERK